MIVGTVAVGVQDRLEPVVVQLILVEDIPLTPEPFFTNVAVYVLPFTVTLPLVVATLLLPALSLIEPLFKLVVNVPTLLPFTVTT